MARQYCGVRTNVDDWVRDVPSLVYFRLNTRLLRCCSRDRAPLLSDQEFNKLHLTPSARGPTSTVRNMVDERMFTSISLITLASWSPRNIIGHLGEGRGISKSSRENQTSVSPLAVHHLHYCPSPYQGCTLQRGGRDGSDLNPWIVTDRLAKMFRMLSDNLTSRQFFHSGATTKRCLFGVIRIAGVCSLKKWRSTEQERLNERPRLGVLFSPSDSEKTMSSTMAVIMKEAIEFPMFCKSDQMIDVTH